MTRVRAKEIDGIIHVKAMAMHEMLTYGNAKMKGVKPNFITNWTATVGNEVVFDLATGQFLSKNPVIKFKFKYAQAKKGEKLTLKWRDFLNNTESLSVVIE
jgi:sulfur-oxidizing protein SoxZ